MKKQLLAAVLAVTMFATACSTSWITQAQAILTAVLPVAVNIIQLITALQASGTTSATDTALAQKWANTVQADLTTLKTLLDQYNAASVSAKPGVLAEIQTAIGVAQTDLATLLPALHITNPQTVAKITAIIGLVAAEIQSVASLVSIAQGKTSGWRILTAKQPLNAKQFKASYKTVVKAPSGYAPLDQATAGLVLN